MTESIDHRSRAVTGALIATLEGRQEDADLLIAELIEDAGPLIATRLAVTLGAVYVDLTCKPRGSDPVRMIRAAADGLGVWG